MALSQKDQEYAPILLLYLLIIVFPPSGVALPWSWHKAPLVFVYTFSLVKICWCICRSNSSQGLCPDGCASNVSVFWVLLFAVECI